MSKPYHDFGRAAGACLGIVLYVQLSLFEVFAAPDAEKTSPSRSSMLMIHRVVLAGDSITNFWFSAIPEFFPDETYENAGVSGNKTRDILRRFRTDVISRRPEMVVILAGTNDIAEDKGPAGLIDIMSDILLMTLEAKRNGIVPEICSVTPVSRYFWKPQFKPIAQINQLNAMLKQFAAENKLVYLDYYSALADKDGSMPEIYSYDGTHPTPAAYIIIARLLEEGIMDAVKR